MPKQSSDYPSFFSSVAPFYEWLTTHSLQRDVIAKLDAALPRSGRILDVACGPGIILEAVLRSAPARSGIGIDRAEGALARAEKRVEVVHGSADDLPFEDDAFEAAYISGALYLMPEPRKVLAEMKRVSRSVVCVFESLPHGRSFVRTLNPREPLSLKERFDYLSWFAFTRAVSNLDPTRLPEDLRAVGLHDVQTADVARGMGILVHGTSAAGS